MDRLKYILLLAGVFPVVSGSIIIALLTVGYYSWSAFVISVVIGLIVGVPISYGLSRRIKREDPHFDHRRKGPDGILPHPDAPEI